MKKLSFGGPSGGNFERWALAAFKQIEQASYEDIETIFDGFTVTGTYVETRTLNTDTATLPDIIALIATLISDVKKRGQNRQQG